MAHFAQLDEKNIVLQVIVVSNGTINNEGFPASEATGVAFCQSLLGADTVWKQTSYNGNFRKNYAGIGYTYDVNLDAFVPPQPYPSWTLDTEKAQWVCPVSYPEDGKTYSWDEATQSWVEVV